MSSIEKLSSYFSKFPGIGPRQAKRFVYFLLLQNEGFLNELTNLILNLKKDIKVCVSCHRFFSFPNKETTICDVCQNPNTDHSMMLILEKDSDFENIKKTGSYEGKYFILGGSVPILEQNPAEKIRARELFTEVQKQAKQKTLKEVILALSANPEGDNTVVYLKKILEPISQKFGIKISVLGRGLSTGTELEYSDSHTLKSALENRG